MIDGLSYMRAHTDVARIALIKGGWALVGGALLLLTVFGDRLAAGIGLSLWIPAMIWISTSIDRRQAVAAPFQEDPRRRVRVGSDGPVS